MSTLKLQAFAEELQDYIEANSNLGYAAGTNFLLGHIYEIEDVIQAPSLTMYEEAGGSIEFGRIPKTNRNIRFVFRDTYAQGALNRAFAFVEWAGKENNRRIQTSTFNVWLVRFFKMPTVVAAQRSNIYAADVVILYAVLSRL